MRLFDENGNMPSGVKLVIEGLLKNVAPDMAKDIDVIAVTVASFKAQLDRIEANQISILSAMENLHHGPARTSLEGNNRPHNGAGTKAGD